MNYFKEFNASYCICENKSEKETAKHYEGVFTQGSGYLHIRGSHEEGLADACQNDDYMRLPANVTIEKPRNPLSKWGIYIPGITGLHPLLKEEIINLPYLLSFKVSADGTVLDMDHCDITNYKRRLDMRDGLLYREFDWTPGGGNLLHCFYSRYVSRSRKNLLVQQMSFTAVNGGCEVTFESDIDENVRTNGYNHFCSVRKRHDGNQTDLALVTDNGDEVLMASRAFSTNVRFAAGGNAVTGAITLGENEQTVIYKLSCAVTSRDKDAGADGSRETGAQLDDAEQNLDRLYSENEAVWRELWENAVITIEGDSEAQLAVNFSIYHLLRAANPDDNRVAICAKGFAGEAYFGHFFWDTEVYLLPFYLYTNPRAAKALAGFRINTLGGAERNAAAYGYHGARYAWESSLQGDEQCPNWQYADHEVHVTADVVYGLWLYYRVTMDGSFLLKALPVFIQAARYWLERMERKVDGTISLNGVMGPDEYLCFCNNDAYTNYMVSYALKKASEAARFVKAADPSAFAALGVTEAELETFEDAADDLKLRRCENGIIGQCDNFENLEELDFSAVWSDRTKPFGHFISQERNYRSKALKQADVLMLPFLFPSRFAKKQIEVNYDYYFPYTTHDSSLSYIVHAMLCCKIDRPGMALELFRNSLEQDLNPQKAGAAEGIHIANCGGIWQALIFGFAGMSRDCEGDVPEFAPALPAHWKSLFFQIIYKGRRYRVSINQSGTSVERVDRNV